jgi:hypothetical protein
LTAAAPLRQKPVDLVPSRAVRLPTGQQQRPMGGYYQRGWPGHTLSAPPLRLSYPQSGFLVPMIDLDLPAVQRHLQQWAGGRAPISGQQEGRTPLAEPAVFGAAVRNGSHDQQPEPSWAGPAWPQHILDFLLAQLPALAAVPSFAALPSQALVLPDLLGRELFLRLPPARAGRSRSAPPHIGARAAEPVDAVQWRAEQGAVAEATSARYQQGLGLRSGLLQTGS